MINAYNQCDIINWTLSFEQDFYYTSIIPRVVSRRCPMGRIWNGTRRRKPAETPDPQTADRNWRPDPWACCTSVPWREWRNQTVQEPFCSTSLAQNNTSRKLYHFIIKIITMTLQSWSCVCVHYTIMCTGITRETWKHLHAFGSIFWQFWNLTLIKSLVICTQINDQEPNFVMHFKSLLMFIDVKIRHYWVHLIIDLIRVLNLCSISLC